MDTSIKTCFKCGCSKPLDDFYKHPQMADGHLNKCKECTRKDTAERTALLSKNPLWAVLERRRHREKATRYRESGKIYKGDEARRRQKIAEYKRMNPLKTLARQMVSNAIRDGKLKRMPCEKCGAFPAQGHHDDYNKPLDVRWLCPKHHGEHHALERDAEILSQLFHK